jgi:DNA-binding GntR family transcriptional regulator
MRRLSEEFTALVKRKDFTGWVDAPENHRRLSMLDRDFHTTILAAANNRVARRFFENAQVLSLVVSSNFLQAELVQAHDDRPRRHQPGTNRGSRATHRPDNGGGTAIDRPVLRPVC